MRAASRLCCVWGRLAVCRARAMSAPGQLERCPRGRSVAIQRAPICGLLYSARRSRELPMAPACLPEPSRPSRGINSRRSSHPSLPFETSEGEIFCVSGLATGGGVGRSTEVQTGRKCGSAPPTYGAILGIGSGIGRLSDVTATSARLSLIALVFDPVTAASRVRTHSHRRARKPSLVRGLPLPDSYRVVCMHGGVHWSAIPFVFMHAR